MDNVTHTLIGLTVAGALARKRATPLERHAFAWTSALANNFPDFDFLIPAVMGGGKLDYLLQHRGYTHTFVIATALGAVSAAVGYGIWRFRERREPAGAPGPGRFPWLAFLGIGVLGSWLHIGADSWNDYGIHPFWPFSNRWFYGDMVSIIEPTIWLLLIPWAIAATTRTWARVAWALAAAALLALIWFGPFVTGGLALALTAWGALWAAAHWGLQGRARAGARTSLAALACLVALFAAQSQRAHRRAAAIVAREPGTEILQEAATPAPGNPFCWRVIVATRGPGLEYRARVGAISLAPALFDPRSCFPMLQSGRTAPLAPIAGARDPDAYWVGEFTSSLDWLQRLALMDCRFREFLRFARVPFWVIGEQGSVAGDLRYDREKGRGFAELALGQAAHCPEHVPPWDPPLMGNHD